MPDSCGFNYILDNKYFRAPSHAVQAQSIASDLPNGNAWAAKNMITKGIYSLVYGCAGVYILIRNMIETLSVEFNLYTSDTELDKWEKSVGLPDTRIGPTPTDICVRRTRVRDKVQKIPTVTLHEMQTRLDTWMPDYGIWLTGNDAIVTESYRYEYRYPYTSEATERDGLVIKVNIPWIAIDPSDLPNSPLRWAELESWLRDFVPAYIRLDPVYHPNSGYLCVIKNVLQDQEIYADKIGPSTWADKDIYWMDMSDFPRAVVHRQDTENITSTTTQILRVSPLSGGLESDLKDVTVSVFL
jgi:hypothetical protein